MNGRTRLIVITSAVACVLVVGLILTLRSRGARPAPSTETGGPESAVEVEQPVISHAERGVPAWQLQLQRVEVSTGGETVAAYGVSDGLVYDGQGKPAVRVTADRISGNTGVRNFDVSGNVTVVNRDGTVFSTGSAKWIQQERRLHCPETVTMRNKDATVSATDLDYLVDRDLVVCPNSLKMNDGGNILMGRNLQYNVKTAAFELQDVQAVFNPAAVRERLRGAGPTAPSAPPAAAR